MSRALIGFDGPGPPCAVTRAARAAAEKIRRFDGVVSIGAAVVRRVGEGVEAWTKGAPGARRGEVAMNTFVAYMRWKVLPIRRRP